MEAICQFYVLTVIHELNPKLDEYIDVSIS